MPQGLSGSNPQQTRFGGKGSSHNRILVTALLKSVTALLYEQVQATPFCGHGLRAAVCSGALFRVAFDVAEQAMKHDGIPVRQFKRTVRGRRSYIRYPTLGSAQVVLSQRIS